jgi:hypothetical protein
MLTPEGEAAANTVHATMSLMLIFYLLQRSIWYLKVSKFHLTPRMMGTSLHTHIQISLFLRSDEPHVLTIKTVRLVSVR